MDKFSKLYKEMRDKRTFIPSKGELQSVLRKTLGGVVDDLYSTSEGWTANVMNMKALNSSVKIEALIRYYNNPVADANLLVSMPRSYGTYWYSKFLIKDLKTLELALSDERMGNWESAESDIFL